MEVNIYSTQNNNYSLMKNETSITKDYEYIFWKPSFTVGLPKMKENFGVVLLMWKCLLLIDNVQQYIIYINLLESDSISDNADKGVNFFNF
jgi:hypothetical protein